MYAERGSDLQESRTKLREILKNLGDAVPPDLQHVRQDEQEAEASPSDGSNAWESDDGHEVPEAGPSQTDWHCKQDTGRSDFEVAWARLPPAITSLPSFINIKDLVTSNLTGPSSFRRSLPVLPNGIDHLFTTRPAFRQILNDLDNEYQDADFDPIEQAGLLPPHPDPLTMTEALWESQFGVTRTLAWYSALARSPIGVTSCLAVSFPVSQKLRLGLHRKAVDSAGDTVHCAVAGTKRPIFFVGPACGLMYAVVQGTLLMISWPSSDRNFFALHRRSRDARISQFEHLDDFENPAINILHTGDALYLPCGTMNAFVSLTNVCLTSRQFYNPYSKEINTMLRCSERLIRTCIKKQYRGYSPFDDLEVEKLDWNLKVWRAFVKQEEKNTSCNKDANSNARTEGLNLAKNVRKRLRRGLDAIQDDIKRYRQLVDKSSKRGHRGFFSHHDRPFETLEAVAELATAADLIEAASPSLHTSAVERLSPQMCAQLNLKGKDRAPS